MHIYRRVYCEIKVFQVAQDDRARGGVDARSIINLTARFFSLFSPPPILVYFRRTMKFIGRSQRTMLRVSVILKFLARVLLFSIMCTYMINADEREIAARRCILFYLY